MTAERALASVVPSQRLLATVRDYNQFHNALRARASELKVTREAIDAVSGLQDGYSAKLLAPVPIRIIGRDSLGPLLAALGLVLILAEDAETLAKITKRMEKRRVAEADAGCGMQAERRKRKRRFSPFKVSPEFAKIARAQQILRQGPQERQRIASRAAKARWGKGRKRREKPNKTAVS